MEFMALFFNLVDQVFLLGKLLGFGSQLEETYGCHILTF